MRPLRATAHYFRNTDLYLLLLAICCSVYGLVLINSATASSILHDRYMTVQAAAIGIGLIAFIIMSLVDLESIKRYWRILLIINVVVQLSLYFFGDNHGGNKSWIDLGFVSIQPGEIGRIVFIITFAAHLVAVHEEINRWQTLIGLGMHQLCVYCNCHDFWRGHLV